MSDSEEEQTIADDIVVTKFKMAGDICNRVLTQIIKETSPGKKVLELCILGDRLMIEETNNVFKKEKEMKKGIAFPTCISVNNFVCHYSPLRSDQNDPELKDGDMVKIDLGVHIDGLAAVVAHTLIVDSGKGDDVVTGRKADVLLAAHYASEACLRLVKPGNENYKVTEAIGRLTEEFKCKPVEGMQCHQMRQHVYDAEKSIVWNPSDEIRKSVEKCEFAVHEVWNIDVLVSTGEGKAKETDARTTVYKRKDTVYQLKMKASRQFFSEMCSKFQYFPFTLRSCEDEKKARMGVVECVNHDLVQPLRVFIEKEGEFVAQFKYTLLLMPNGPLRITGVPVDLTKIKSEHSIQDEDLKSLLATSISRKANKKRRKKVEKAALETVAAEN